MRRNLVPQCDEQLSASWKGASDQRDLVSVDKTLSAPPLGETSNNPICRAQPQRSIMRQPSNPRGKSFTASRSAAEETEMMSDEHSWDNEGGHMSSTAGRVMRSSGADLPYIVVLTHHLSDATRHSFATMHEAEAFIKRNTPVPGAVLSTTYDRPASDLSSSPPGGETAMKGDYSRRLRVIVQRLQQISTHDAASVLALGLANAGICEDPQLRLIEEIECVLDELDDKNVGRGIV